MSRELYRLDFDLGKQFTEFVKQVEIAWQLDFPSLENLDFTEECRQSIDVLARHGWTIPMNLSAPDLVELAKCRSEEIDEFFVDYYSKDDFAELRSVRSEFRKRPSLSHWIALLNESFEAFEEGKFLITIPALISVIEGVVSRADGVLSKQKVDVKQICARRVGEAKGFVHVAMWRSLRFFCEELFRRAPFDRGRPSLINRHWILHGRDAATWTAADSLRLFNALQTVDSLLE